MVYNYILYSVHCTLYTVHCVYTGTVHWYSTLVQYTQCTVHCTLYIVQCTLCVHWTLYSVQCTVHCVYTGHCTMYTLHCTVYMLRCCCKNCKSAINCKYVTLYSCKVDYHFIFVLYPIIGI